MSSNGRLCAAAMLRTVMLCLLLGLLLAWGCPRPALGARNYENERTAFAYMINDMKLSPASACGIMANLYAESNFSTTVWDRSGVSYGICQWLGTRKTALFNFCASRGLERSSLTAQLRFMEHELLTIYPSAYNAIRGVSNDEEGAYDAAYTFCYQFERPANKAWRSAQRGGYAKNIFWPEYGALSARLEASVAENGILLTWNASTGKVYLIYRSETENGDYRKIGKASGSEADSYVDSTARKGVVYYYQLRSYAEPADEAFWSNKVSVLHGMKMEDPECDIALSKAEYTYSGKEKKPKVTVKYDGKTLVKNQDYTVAYEKNVNAGKNAAVLVTGKGDYSGTAKITFRIRKAKQKLNDALLEVPFTGKAESIDVGQEGKVKLYSSDRRVLKVKGQKLKCVKYGTARIRIVASSTKNYKSAEVTVDAVTVPPDPFFRGIAVVRNDGKKLDVRLRWSARKKPDAFEIQYTSKSVFGRSAVKLRVTKGKLRTWKITGLDAGKQWRFRIRAVKTIRRQEVKSGWSETVETVNLGDS